MALALLLRNAVKFTAAATVGQLKTSKYFIRWKKTYSILIAVQQIGPNAAATVASIKPYQLMLKKNQHAPIQRKISLSARRMATGETENFTPIWKAERLLDAALLMIIPAAFLAPSRTMDVLLAISVVIHTHWGVEKIIVDYLRPRFVGPTVPKAAYGLLLLLNMLTLGGIFHFINNDIGIAKTVQELWATRSTENIPPPPPPEPPKKRRCKLFKNNKAPPKEVEKDLITKKEG